MQETNNLLFRSVAEGIGTERLEARLQKGEKLRIKFGVDPTSPNLHLGRAVPILKLRDFQQAGHTIVFIIGDFTGVIGDTSDKESERPMLARETVEENLKTYFAQAGKLLDLEKTEMHRNSEWLGKLSYSEIGEHADAFSVSDFISRENIKKRLDAGKRVSLREVLYPLMQGYDSVAVRADVEIGGTDQRFNLLAGRALQERAGQEPQAILMNPLIMGTDGRKMSSSWGNTINLTDEPEDMYGKVMSVHDELVTSYFMCCTRIPLQELEDIQSGFVDGTLHPKEAKMRLAREIVTLYHGEGEARHAEAMFVRTFQEGGVPDDIEAIATQKNTPLIEAVLFAKIVESKGEWRRLVEGGGVHRVDQGKDETISDVQALVTETLILRIGKRRFVKIVV